MYLNNFSSYILKPSQRKLDGNLLFFIASHPFSICLFFLKHPVLNVNVASSWTRHSWITVFSCHCEGRHGVFMQTNVNTFTLEIMMAFVVTEKIFVCPFGLLLLLHSYGCIQQLANHMLPLSALWISCGLWSCLQLLSMSVTETDFSSFVKHTIVTVNVSSSLRWIAYVKLHHVPPFT